MVWPRHARRVCFDHAGCSCWLALYRYPDGRREFVFRNGTVKTVDECVVSTLPVDERAVTLT